MRIRVDIQRCSGHARCVTFAPDVFELDELGYNVTPLNDVVPGHEDNALRAVDACPEGALSVEE